MGFKLNLGRLITGYRSVEASNRNDRLIEEAIDNTLSRDGSGPNAMAAPLDMNGFPILNCPNLGTTGGPTTPITVDPTTLFEQMASAGLFDDFLVREGSTPIVVSQSFTQANLDLATSLFNQMATDGLFDNFLVRET